MIGQDTSRTWTPGELHEVLNGLLAHVFGQVVWVEGELVDLSRSRSGHVYFRLLDAAESTRPDARPSLSVTLFDSDRRSVNRFLRSEGDPIRMTDGVRVRIGGRLATYPARSTVQLQMDRIDPAFTLGLLSRDRIRLLATLEAEGLLARNGSIAIAPVPLHVGLVTSVGSAAHADALDELRRADLGFRISLLDARTQGVDAPGAIVDALRTATTLGVDVVLLVRGGGAATDLAAFDDEGVARAIAACPVPVVTGIGHETDTTVADATAHAAHKTPTAAAASIVEVVRVAERRFGDDWTAIRSSVDERLKEAAVRLGRIGHRGAMASKLGLARQSEVIGGRARQVRAGAQHSLGRVDDRLAALTARRQPAVGSALGRTEDRLAILAARCNVHDPGAAMRRGWTITRTGAGRAIRSVDDARTDDELVTTTTDGTIRSRVLEVRRGPSRG